MLEKAYHHRIVNVLSFEKKSRRPSAIAKNPYVLSIRRFSGTHKIFGIRQEVNIELKNQNFYPG